MFAADRAKGAAGTKLKPRMNRTLVALATACLSALGTISAHADTLTMGILSNYSVVSLGNGQTTGGTHPTLSQNSGPIAGSELVGQGVKAAFSGGGHGAIAGTVYYDSTVTGTNTFSQFDPPPTTSLVDPSVTHQAYTDAIALANAANQLQVTQNFTSTISSAQTFTGNGGLNVIDVTNIQNAPITFAGTANDIFVINVSGKLNTNVAMTLGANVSASHILWNFTGTASDVFQTSGGNKVYGTFLAVTGGGFQFSNLDLTGELINVNGDVSIVSGSAINTFVPFTGTPAPLPSVVTASSALLGLVLLGRLRRHHPRTA